MSCIFFHAENILCFHEAFWFFVHKIICSVCKSIFFIVSVLSSSPCFYCRFVFKTHFLHSLFALYLRFVIAFIFIFHFCTRIYLVTFPTQPTWYMLPPTSVLCTEGSSRPLTFTLDFATKSDRLSCCCFLSAVCLTASRCAVWRRHRTWHRGERTRLHSLPVMSLVSHFH